MNETIISADQLLTALSCTAIGPKELILELLQSPPVAAAKGRPRWPPASAMTVRQLFETRIKPEESPVPHAAGFWVEALMADAAIPILNQQDLLPEDGMSVELEQFAENTKAAARLFEPHMDKTVREMVLNPVDELGFINGYGLDAREVIEAQLLEWYNNQAKLVETVALSNGHTLKVWRAGMSVETPGEKVYDITAMVFDEKDLLSAHLDARLVFLPNGCSGGEAVYRLDAYDAEGLALGYGLKELVERRLAYEEEVFDGGGLFHLETMEVRHDCRGTGIGRELLRLVLPAAVRGVRRKVTKMALALTPLQFDYPLAEGTPVEMVVEGLDAAESLLGYFLGNRPQQYLPHAKNSSLLFLPTDRRSAGSHFDQLELLVESAGPRNSLF
jgi:GNAT superfamily N-acetyltransferase